MQSGEMDSGPKPSEIEIVPKTFGEKISNIWYHYSKLIIASLLILILVVVMVTQCATRTKYDLQIVYFTYQPVLDSYTTKMASYFEKYCEDVNGDGEVHITVANCSVDPNSNNTANMTKLQVLIAAEPSAILYITDDKSIKYFDNINTTENTLFDGEPIPLSEEFYEYVKDDAFTNPQNLSISIRKIKGTELEKDKKAEKSYMASKKIFDAIK